MDMAQAVTALGALAHESRLRAFRILVQRGPQGVSAGILAERLAVPPSSLTFHLQQLFHAGLASQRRRGRQIIYTADYAAMNDLMAYLTENCCGESAVGCDPATFAERESDEAPASASDR